MKAILPVLCVAAVLIAATPSAFGQPAPPAADLTGAWTLQATFELPPVETPALVSGLDAQNGGPICGYQGTAAVTQNGQGGFTGTASMHLVSGDDPPCPSEMNGTLTGTLAGDMVAGTLSDPNLGTADFTGTLTGLAAAGTRAISAQAHAGLMIMGNVTNVMGPISATDSFIAISAPSVIEVPTLGTVGLAALILLLAAAAAYLLIRRRTA